MSHFGHDIVLHSLGFDWRKKKKKVSVSIFLLGVLCPWCGLGAAHIDALYVSPLLMDL